MEKETVQLSFRLSQDVAKRFKAALAMDGNSSQEVLEGFVQDYVAKSDFAIPRASKPKSSESIQPNSRKAN